MAEGAKKGLAWGGVRALLGAVKWLEWRGEEDDPEEEWKREIGLQP